jgi:diguanylate cyclase (GGDEF)-like protein
MTNGNWTTGQLAEFLAVVSAVPEPGAAIREAIERGAEALEAELGAVVQNGAVVASVGFPAGAVPEAELAAMAAGDADVAEVPGLGPCRTAVAPLEVDDGQACMVLARLGEDPFDRTEVALLRGMTRVLSLTLRMLHLLADERGLRSESERQAADNARLLASLEERRLLHEQIAKLQETMSHRTPLQEVLDAIADGAGDLVGEPIVALRLVDAADNGHTVIAAWRGVEDRIAGMGKRMPAGDGIGGRAIAEARLVVTDEYAAESVLVGQPIAADIQAAMAVPLHEHGTVIGSLTVASRTVGRRFASHEQDLLLDYARQASLALAAARTVDTMRHAFSDSLTGLANRALFLERLDQALGRAQRAGRDVTVLFLDLDRFKPVNDSLGHVAGDTLLVAAADRIRRSVRGAETVARLGGDEFAVLLEDLESPEDAVRVAEQIRRELQAPLVVADRDVAVSASIGIASGNGSAEDLVRDADVAMYRAKGSGPGRYQVFESGMHAEVVARLELEADIQRAVDRQEFVVHYQPIVALDDGRIVGVEALARWNHPERGLVPPCEFIPISEETGLIVPIGRLVLRQATRQAAIWQSELGPASPLAVSVNLAARQLAQPVLIDEVTAAIEDARLTPGTLLLELTETVIMNDTDATIEQLRALHAIGVRIAVDDFGTGYSSLRYLQRFPIDILKIAKPFVDGVADDSDEAIMARTVVDLGRNLGLATIAEGIETEDQARALRKLGCPLGQGYLYSRPLPADAMTALLLGDAQSTPAGACERIHSRSGVSATRA